MKSDNSPKAADISALKEIVAGGPADDLTIHDQRGFQRHKAATLHPIWFQAVMDISSHTG